MNTSKTMIFDLETNGLLHKATVIHCGAVYIHETKELLKFASRPMEDSSGTIDDMVSLLETADTLVAHNLIGFDLPILKKLTNFNNPNVRLIDTLLVSKLLYPAIIEWDMANKNIPGKYKGKHSLASWGVRLGNHKGDFGDQINAWDTLTPEMLNYCTQDTLLLVDIYNHFLAKGMPNSETMNLEHSVATIIQRQEAHGVFFNIKAAERLHVELMQEQEELDAEIRKVFKPLKTWQSVNYPKKPFLKDGVTKAAVLVNQEAKGCHFNDEGEWGMFVEVDFNPNSRAHITKWLTELYNWQPTEFTDKNTPKVDETVLESLEYPEAKLLAKMFKCNKVLGMVAIGKNAWLKLVDPENSRIHGRADSLGAVTRRFTHNKPNLAQTPSSSAYKGKECRSLFIAPKGKKLVGCDADALELRTLAHFMAKYDNGAYAEVVDKGDKDKGTDIHTTNQRAAGLPTRDNAKTFIYGYLYGAGDAKIGQIVNLDAAEGKRLREKFLKGLPALALLTNKVKDTVKKTGTLKALDGHPYHVRSQHSALNTLLQGAGALVMKYFLIFLDKELQAKFSNNQYEFVLNIHDEVQIECDEGIAEEVAKTCEETFGKVTEYLNFRIPLRGNAAIGFTWAQTH